MTGCARTPLAHLIDDFNKQVPDDDVTHVEEWIQNVTKAGGIPDHYRRLARTGSIHHHVWVAEDIKEVLQYLGLEAVCCENEVADRSDSFVVVGQKKN
jgi:DNA-directed RNA polymerase subunit N (RpoN/RPB10)